MPEAIRKDTSEEALSIKGFLQKSFQLFSGSKAVDAPFFLVDLNYLIIFNEVKPHGGRAAVQKNEILHYRLSMYSCLTCS